MDMTRTDRAARDERPETKKQERRDLGPLGNAVSERVEELLDGYVQDRPEAVATLAQLRGGAGKAFGECPQLWGLTVDAHEYASPSWSREQHDRAEEAVHAAITLFALHQQSLRGPSGGGAGSGTSGKQREGVAGRDRTDPRMHRRSRYHNGDRGRLPDYGLGWAVRACMKSGEIDPALHNRLKKTAQATSLRTRVVELRQIVARLRNKRVPLDYGLLAEQLFQAQDRRGITRVRDDWGHGFVSYRAPDPDDGTSETTTDDATPEPEKENP